MELVLHFALFISHSRLPCHSQFILFAVTLPRRGDIFCTTVQVFRNFRPSNKKPTAVSIPVTIKKLNILLNPLFSAIPKPSNGAPIMEIPNAMEYNAEYCPCRSEGELDNT